MPKETNPRLTCGRWTAWLLILVVAGFFGGCAAGGDYGSLRPSQEASDMFVKGPVSNDFNYFYSGAANKPRAIIGIDKAYTLETDRWKPVSMESGQLQSMMGALTGYKGFAMVNFGSVILDPAGNKIGVWYSQEADSTTVKMMGENRVSVYPPTRRDAGGPVIIGGGL